tara:strand:+ start:535 stop:1041 length:507 start_codon:yes stop_codon:yes gene_type:complete
MEPVYVEATINDRLIRINKNDSMDIYIWRDCKIKPSYWLKRKPTLYIDKKTGYQRYKVNINKKWYILSRLVYKAYYNDWDITDGSKNNYIDHINNNSLDNRIENLRILTAQENQFNTNAKGYYWCKRDKYWISSIMVNRKKINLGSFKEEEDARNAYLEAKSLYHNIA